MQAPSSIKVLDVSTNRDSKALAAAGDLRELYQLCRDTCMEQTELRTLLRHLMHSESTRSVLPEILEPACVQRFDTEGDKQQNVYQVESAARSDTTSNKVKRAHRRAVHGTVTIIIR